MKHENSRRRLLSSTSAAFLAGVLVIAGCHSLIAHPDVQAAVYKALDSNDFGSIMVSQSREKGVITLTGIVAAASRKPQIEAIVKQAAPGYTIDDKIKVDPAGL